MRLRQQWRLRAIAEHVLSWPMPRKSAGPNSSLAVDLPDQKAGERDDEDKGPCEHKVHAWNVEEHPPPPDDRMRRETNTSAEPRQSARGAVMTFSWDVNTATLLALLTNLVILVAFAVKTHGKATTAIEHAALAQKTADEAHMAIGALSSAFGLYREQVAEKYVDRQAMREMEGRLTAAIKDVGERIDNALHRK